MRAECPSIQLNYTNELVNTFHQRLYRGNELAVEATKCTVFVKVQKLNLNSKWYQLGSPLTMQRRADAELGKLIAKRPAFRVKV